MDETRVLLVTGDKGACAFYRMELPAAMAKTEDLPVEISPGLPGKQGSNGVEVDFDYASEHYDVIVLQRPMKPEIFDAISKLQERGIVVIVEIDDDFTSLHRKNQAYKGTSSSSVNRDLIRQACVIADHVIVSTPALAEVYGAHGRVSIIPNFVPGFLLEWRFVKYPRMCGWSGTVTVHPNDLQVVGDAISVAVDVTASNFMVVGESSKVQSALKLKRRVPETGWLPIVDYWNALGRLTVGIAPLEDSDFNCAKSNLKGLEYAAVGVPFVASPLPEYLLLASRGAGRIARTPDDWYLHVSRLLSDPLMRNELAAAGRQAIIDHYILESNWHLWPEAWERARVSA